jgi:two-component system, cell cycle sensor histidine kinase and response regulator CckA
MNGEQTLQELRLVKPQLRVLLMSGYSEGDILGRLGGSGPLAYIAKPFTRDRLERALRQLLE